MHQDKLPRGLVVVGVTDEPAELVDAYVQEFKPTYPIVIEQGGRSARALGVNGYPTAFLVDPKGTVVWTGHPAGLDEATLQSALKGARPPAVRLPAQLKPLERLIERGEHGKVWESARAMLAGGDLDAEAKQTAEELVAGIETAAQELFADAERRLAAREYFEAVQALEPLAKAYRGVHRWAEAEAKLAELQADPAIKKAIKGGEQLAKARELDRAKDYEKAWAIYRTVAREHAGSQPGDAAAARMREIDEQGLFGFDAACDVCRQQGRACAKHKKKPR